MLKICVIIVETAAKLVRVVCFGPILDKLLIFNQKKNSHPPVYPFLKICKYKKRTI